MSIKAEHDEQYWIDEFRNGHDHALAFFFDLHYKALVFFARNIVQNNDEAEDIVSDCFFKLWQRRQDFASPKNIKAFLFISCRNACLNFLQHLKVRHGAHDTYYRHLPEEEETILSLIIKTEVLDLISIEIDKLPQKMQQVFRMIYFEGKNTNEIADELNLSIQTVRNQKTKAVDLLKLALFKKGISAAAYFPILAFIKSL